jgi:hypothetical protein
MNLRHPGAGAISFALAMFALTLTAPPVAAEPCGAVMASGTFGVVDSERFGFKACPKKPEGRAVQRDRRHFRQGREARRHGGTGGPAVHAGAGGVAGQTDNDGRLVLGAAEPAGERAGGQAHEAVRLARASQAPRGERVAAEILPHPPGCPRRLFCGCGAAVRVFGAPVRALWLAANWFRFPPAVPAPGMVAVRRGHVFVIEDVVGPGRVLAYDANSGRGLTRRHVRSLAGYSVRNPRPG